MQRWHAYTIAQATMLIINRAKSHSDGDAHVHHHCYEIFVLFMLSMVACAIVCVHHHRYEIFASFMISVVACAIIVYM